MSEFTLDSILDSLGEDAPIEKVASRTSMSDALEDTLTKEASASTTGDINMSVENGTAIADSILSMLDGGFDKRANNVADETADMVADHDGAIQLSPLKGNTITEMAKVLASEAQDDDFEAEEGNIDIEDEAEASDIEKSAAINELMEEGYGLDDAFEMVKQASEEMSMNEYEFEKVAAVADLMDEGVDFDSAVELVKEASYEMGYYDEEYSDLEKSAAINELMEEDGLCLEDAFELVKEASMASALKSARKSVGRSVKKVRKAAGNMNKKVRQFGNNVAGKGFANKHMTYGRNRVARSRKQLAGGLAGTAALGGGAYYATRQGARMDFEKIAAVDDLVNEGYDFDEAAMLVKEASLSYLDKVKIRVLVGSEIGRVKGGIKGGVKGLLRPVTKNRMYKKVVKMMDPTHNTGAAFKMGAGLGLASAGLSHHYAGRYIKLEG